MKYAPSIAFEEMSGSAKGVTAAKRGKENGIQTSFVKRGRPSSAKSENDYVRQALARVRATSMEGSFGTQKEHYSLRRVKARKKETEILYIFFGIHTANAVRLADRLVAPLRTAG